MHEEIDNGSYEQGRKDFAAGVSLRTIFEGFIAADNGNDADAVRAASRGLGFADALVDRLRCNISLVDAVVDHGDGTVSLLSQCNCSDGTTRARQRGDVFRKTVKG